jgi:hypothetical protein
VRYEARGAAIVPSVDGAAITVVWKTVDASVPCRAKWQNDTVGRRNKHGDGPVAVVETFEKDACGDCAVWSEMK